MIVFYPKVHAWFGKGDFLDNFISKKSKKKVRKQLGSVELMNFQDSCSTLQIRYFTQYFSIKFSTILKTLFERDHFKRELFGNLSHQIDVDFGKDSYPNIEVKSKY